MYVNYDLKTFINVILTKKMQQSFTLQEFIDEIFKIQVYEQKVKSVKLKNELLSEDIFENKITITDIDLMSGSEFEEFLCNYFNDIGYECERTKATGDQGVDLIAIKDEVKIAIQAKCYSGVVGNHAIMEVFAGAKYYNANKCMVITNSTFTKAAIELAKSNSVVLWDRQVLTEKLNLI
jgi:HJR/Mrr/RecB family endonuclease